jgi:hypothetical protein
VVRAALIPKKQFYDETARVIIVDVKVAMNPLEQINLMMPHYSHRHCSGCATWQSMRQGIGQTKTTQCPYLCNRPVWLNFGHVDDDVNAKVQSCCAI